MGIKIGSNDVLAIYIGSQDVIAVYTNRQLIWPNGNNSCFGNGYWIDEYPWADDEPWID